MYYKFLALLILLAGCFFLNPAHAENQFDCGETANGHTPEYAAACDDTSQLIALSGSPSCSGADSDNSANGQSTHYIIRNNTTSDTLFENTSYDHFHICNNVDVNVTSNIERSCASEGDGYCSVQGYNDSGNWSREEHPYWQADAEKSEVRRMVWASPSEDWKIWGIVLRGNSTGQGMIRFNSVDRMTFSQSFMDTFEDDGTYGIAPGGIGVQCTGSSRDINLQYLYGNGVRMWDQSAYDNIDTHGINIGASCRRVHLFHSELHGYTDGFQTSAGAAGALNETSTIYANDFYAGNNAMACDGGAETSVTITRSGTTATVTQSAHGFSTGDDVLIRGANQEDYNGIRVITATTTNTYDFEVENSPTTPATGTIVATPDEEICLAWENHLDLKTGGQADTGGSPSEHLIVYGNTLSMCRPQGPRVGGGSTFEAGGTGAAEGSCAVIHLNATNIEFVGNILWDFSNGITNANAGFDAGLPQYIAIMKNTFYDWKYRNEDGHANVVSYGLRSSNWGESAILFNTLIPVNSDIQGTLQFGDNNDIMGNLFVGTNNSYTGSTTGSVDYNAYADSSPEISGDTNSVTIASITMSNFTFCTRPITGALIVGGAYDGHHCDEVTLPILADSQVEDQFLGTIDSAKGPQ